MQDEDEQAKTKWYPVTRSIFFSDADEARAAADQTAKGSGGTVVECGGKYLAVMAGKDLLLVAHLPSAN